MIGARVGVRVGVNVGAAVGVGNDELGGGQSPPTFQAAGTLAAGTGNVSPAWPTHQSGDIGLLIIESLAGEAAALGVASGFDEMPDSPQDANGGTNPTRLTVYWCRATSASMTAPTVTDPTNHCVSVILTFRGCVATGDPWDVTAGDAAAADEQVSIPGDTTTVANCLIVAIACHGRDAVSTAEFTSWANADLTDVTERFDEASGVGNGGGIGVATGVKAIAGAYGVTTATMPFAQAQGRISIALRPT